MAETPAVPHKIPNVVAGFMIALAVLMDLLQFLMELLVFTALFAELVTFLALCIYGVWFAVYKVSYFSGKKSGMKVASAFGSAILEMVPILDGLPGITAGVIGIIVSTRIEERQERKVQKNTVVANHVKFSGPQKIPQAANDADRYQEAA